MCRSQRCPATVVEPTSKATPSATSWNPGKTAVIERAVAHRDRRGPVAGAKRLLQTGQHDRVDLEAGQEPVAFQRVEQPLQIARGMLERRLRHLDVVQPHDRVDLDRVGVGLLAHDLAVDLRLGRHVDHQVAADRRVTAEPAIRREPVPLPVPLLGLGERDQVIGRARDAVLRERARPSARPGSARRSRARRRPSRGRPRAREPRRARSHRRRPRRDGPRG